MKVITVANRKGGTGKTTTAYNLAHSFVNENKKVCLLDLDGQGNLTETCKADFLSVEDFINAKTKSVVDNLDIIAACGDFRYLEKIISDELSPTTFLKAEILPKIIGYDYLIVDTSPAYNVINANGYLISNTFLIVMNLDYYSVQGLNNMIDIVSQIKKINPSVECKIVINGYRKNRNLNKKIEPFLSSLKDMFTNVFIPDRQLIKEDILAHRPSIERVSEYKKLCAIL